MSQELNRSSQNTTIDPDQALDATMARLGMAKETPEADEAAQPLQTDESATPKPTEGAIPASEQPPAPELPEPTDTDIESAVIEAIRQSLSQTASKAQEILHNKGFDAYGDAYEKINQVATKQITKLFSKETQIPTRPERTQKRGGGSRRWINRAIAGAGIAGIVAGGGYYAGHKYGEVLRQRKSEPKPTPTAKLTPEKVGTSKPETQKPIKPEQLPAQKLEINRKTGADSVWDAIKLQIVPRIISGTDWKQGVISKTDLLTDAIKDDWVTYCHAHNLNPNLVDNGDVVTLGKFLKPETQAELALINKTISLEDYLGAIARPTQTQRETVQKQIQADAAKKDIEIQFIEKPVAPQLASKPASAQAHELNKQAAQATKPAETPAPALLPQPAYEPPINAPDAQPKVESSISVLPAQPAIDQPILAPEAQPKVDNSITAPDAYAIQKQVLNAPAAQPLTEGKFVAPQTITAPDALPSGPDYSSWDYGTKKKKKPFEF